MFYDLQKIFGDFSRPFKEVDCAKLYKKEKGYILVINALGIGKDNIKVDISYDTEETGNKLPIISVSGSQTNKYSGKDYTLSYRAAINIAEQIKQVNYDCEDGICTIFIEVEKPKELEKTIVKPVDKNFNW